MIKASNLTLAIVLLSLACCTNSTTDSPSESLVSSVSQSSANEELQTFTKYVDESGNIRVPADYRDWVHLGTWSLANNNEPGAGGIHVVYTQKGVAEHYEKTGEFMDGAILVKELLGAQTESLSTGIASSAKDVSGYFVMVKDTKGRFADNPLWGDGWGWAYFEVADLIKTTSTNFKTDCLGCHVPVKENDWVFVQGYPRLN